MGSVADRVRDYVDSHALDGWGLTLIDRLIPAQFRGMKVNPLAVSGKFIAARDATVTVVIPCYNYGRFLRDAVESATSQEGVDVQVIIVNDASPDDTATIADELAAADHRVEVIHNEANLGHVRTFNRGLELAKGEFLVRLDADDLLTPGCLSRAVALFDAEPSLGLVYGHPRHFTTDEPPAPRTRAVTWTVWDGRDWLRERCRRGVNCITTPEAMLRMSVVDRLGPLDTRLRFAQDMEMWCRVATVADVGRVNGVDQALHRDHLASMSATDGEPILVDLIERRTVFEAVFTGTGAALSDAPALHRLARSALSREALWRAWRVLRAGGEPERVAELTAFVDATDPEVLSRRDRQLLEAGLSGMRHVVRRVVLWWDGRIHSLRWAFDYVLWTRRGI